MRRPRRSAARGKGSGNRGPELNRAIQNRLVIALATEAEEAFENFHRLDDDQRTDPDRLEEAALAIDALSLALARLPATSTAARAAKVRAARRLFGPAPTAALIADSAYCERELAASILRDAVAVTSPRRSAA